MSLVELIIVVMIMGVVLAGVFLFFTKGSESFHFARRQNELDTAARMILDKITNELIWAGYMPEGGWSGDDWHPVVMAYEDSIEVFFDKEPHKSLQPTDYMKVRTVGDRVNFVDRGGNEQFVGHNVTDLEFTYLDDVGNDLGAPLITQDERDQVRHIGVDVTLTKEQGGHIYQTVMHTTVSPRNLGVNHDIEPLFFAPPILKGNVAFNCAGSDTNPTPTVHELVMITHLVNFGFTVSRLTDAMCDTFDYSDIDLIMLRRRSDPLQAHPSLGTIHSQDSIPVITFQPQDAYLMGLGTVAGDSLADHQMRVRSGYWNWHPVVIGFDSVFYVYDADSSDVYQYGLLADTSLADSTFTEPYLSPGYAGVVCNNYPAGSPGERRIFFSAYQANKYSKEGEELFYNIVKWSTGAPGGSPGTPFTEMEDFEKPEGGQAELTLWDDYIRPDSGAVVTPIYEEYFSGGSPDLSTWTFYPGSYGGRVFVRTTTPDANVLQMDNTSYGSWNTNYAWVELDMTSYSEYSDDITLFYDSKKLDTYYVGYDDVFLYDLDYGTTQKIDDIDSLTTDWATYEIDLDEAVRNCSFATFSANDWAILFRQYGYYTYDFGQGRILDDIVVGEVGPDSMWVDGWIHARMDTSHVDDWAPDIVPASGNGYSWTTWANHPTMQEYSNGSYCYLQTPAVMIPNLTWDTPPKLSFDHLYDTQLNSDGGYVQIRQDGGAWEAPITFPSSGTSASDFPGGAGIPIFTGSSGGWVTEEIDLSAYQGHTVEFRFVFGSNGATVNDGWMLDNFEISGQVTGYAVTGLDFMATSVPSAPWSTLDVYMGTTTDTEFAGSGEWNKGSMTQVVSAGTFSVDQVGWNRLDLDQPFLLAPGQNLQVKIEVNNGVTGSGNDWNVADLSASAYRCRNDYGGSDPTTLYLNYDRPNVQLVTNQGILRPVPGSGASGQVPMCDDQQFSDCEMIYLGAELTGGGAGWTHGGTADDWEIGYPMFTPDIDPALTPGNGNSVAGNDLTDDGYYNDEAACWLMSPAYEMPGTSYDTVVVRYDRCIRAENDVCWVEIGFTTDGSPPDSADWQEVRNYPGPSHDYWDNEEVNLSAEFENAEMSGMNYFFIRFFLSTGAFLEDGGWNVDNIQFYGRNM